MISVFTPVHAKAAPFLQATYESLCAQTFADWEWVVVTNAGGCIPEDIAADLRVKIFPADDDQGYPHNLIGRLKGFACGKATGDILVELDADDLLTSNALHEINLAFQDSAVAMVYSNSAEFKDGTWEPNTYSEHFGWRTRPFFYKGHALIEMLGWPVSAQMMRQIFWAPNHVRAWRTCAYHALGGHDQTIKTGDDHDLCCRFYIAYGERGVKHIDKCLYVYRVHAENSCATANGEVQLQTAANYMRYRVDMATRWSHDKDLALIDIGGRLNALPGFTTVDLFDADITADLNGKWPFEDSTVGVLRCSHVLEHLKDPVHAMNEAFRVLAPGGWMFIEVPSTDGRGAFQDPTHVSFWNSNSMWYYTREEFSRFVPAFKGRFQNSRTVNYFPSQFEQDHNIVVVQADLIAVKGSYALRPVGQVLI